MELVATAPAKMFGLYPRKGTIAPGPDADIVIFDPRQERVISATTHHMRVDYSAYEGRVVRGLPEIVIPRGEVFVDKRQFLGKPGRGKVLAEESIRSHLTPSSSASNSVSSDSFVLSGGPAHRRPHLP